MPSLNETWLNNALVRPGGLWREVQVVTETGSTNADLLTQARAGAPEGVVLVAEAQTAGRGRLGRQWASPPRAALTFSVLLRPAGVPAGLLGWLPLLTGVAVVTALRETAAVEARLKWPNDVLVGDAKLAGILAESRGDAVVAGVGINVYQRQEELPIPGATSLRLAGSGLAGSGLAGAGLAGAGLAGPGLAGPGPTGPEVAGAGGGHARERLLAAVLGELGRRYLAWRDQARPGDAGACGLRDDYQQWCATVGREVVVTLPGGQSLTGVAAGVDQVGRLEVRTGSGVMPVSAGDVVHVR